MVKYINGRGYHEMYIILDLFKRQSYDVKQYEIDKVSCHQDYF